MKCCIISCEHFWGEKSNVTLILISVDNKVSDLHHDHRQDHIKLIKVLHLKFLIIHFSFTAAYCPFVLSISDWV